MEITREELNPCTIRLTIACEPDEVRVGFQKALKQIAKKVKLPGFRPGNAPPSMVEGLIDKDELYNEAAEQIVRATFKRAVEQEGLQPDPTIRPSLEISSLDRDSLACEYIAKVPLPAKVTLGDYRGLPLDRPDVEVSDEEVDRQIDEFRKRRQTREAVTERGVEEGDVAVVNVKKEGDSGEGRVFMSVAGQMFEGFDAAIHGMKVEEMKNVELTFPETFTEKDWAGQTLPVQITISSLSAVRLPELDDDFAKSLQTESVEDLRQKVRDGIRRAKDSVTGEMVTEKLLEALHARSEIHVSDNMWEQLADRRLEETAVEQREKGRSLEQYAQENGMTLDQLIEAWREKAKVNVERALLIREVFTAEKMQLTNPELNYELSVMAREYGVEIDAMLRTLQENQAVDELHFRAISRKVSQFLEANAAKPE